MTPRWLFAVPCFVGTWLAVAGFPVQRHNSKEFLGAILGRRADLRDVWRHFFRYLEFLLLRLRIANGEPAKGVLAAEDGADFEYLMRSGEPAFFGTFHFGHSDLLGFLLAREGRRVTMVRLRISKSGDTALLGRKFVDAVSFVWVNEPDNLVFAIKTAVERGDSLAMQCDLLFSSRVEGFRFLGATRQFPFAIYHLAILFSRPVMFCIGLPHGRDATHVLASPLFRPDLALGREKNLELGRRHFQAVLARLEILVRQFPHLWFNFLPLNPEVVAGAVRVPAAGIDLSRSRRAY